MTIRAQANPFILDLVRYMPGKPIEETARELGMEPEDIIKLASNENPVGPSPKAVEAMAGALAQSHIYPDGAAFELCESIGSSLGVSWEQVVMGNGSSEVIELLCHSFLSPETEMIVSQYSFSMYKVMATLFGAKFTEVPAKNYGHDLVAMLRAIGPQTRLIFITNPNNPTGTKVSQEELDAFMDKVPAHVVVVLDEAYIEYLDDKDKPNTVKYVQEGKNVCLLRTFSKLQGLAGLRIGYGVATPALADLLHKSRAPFNANAIAQVGALAALKDTAHLEKSLKINKEGLSFFEKEFQKRGLTYIPSYGNFILVEVGNGQEVFEAMLQKGVIIRAMGSSGLPEWIRITIGYPDQNQKCLDVLDAVLAEKK